MSAISTSSSWSFNNQVLRREKSSTEGLIQTLTYNKFRKLGSGVAGEVHLYKCTETEKSLAVKVSNGMHHPVKSEYEVSLKWPKGATGLLLRPKAYFISEVNDFYVMHLYDGDVQNMLAHLNPYDKIEIIRQMCQGLSTLHEIGIAHGDVHLANVFFDKKQKRFDLGDFGRTETMENNEPKFYSTIEKDLKDLREAIESLVIGEEVDALEYMLKGYQQRIHLLEDVQKHGFDLEASSHILDFMLHTPKSAKEILQHFTKIANNIIQKKNG